MVVYKRCVQGCVQDASSLLKVLLPEFGSGLHNAPTTSTGTDYVFHAELFLGCDVPFVLETFSCGQPSVANRFEFLVLGSSLVRHDAFALGKNEACRIGLELTACSRTTGQVIQSPYQ